MKLRRINCCKCGRPVRLPVAWMSGIETVFRCPHCKTLYKTGYQAGAALFALSLTLALASANLLAWVFSSRAIVAAAAAVVPLWLFFGVLLRRSWMVFMCKRRLKREK